MVTGGVRKRPTKRRRLSVEHDDERTDYLANVVKTLNSNDEDASKELIGRLCTSDCVYMERYFDLLPVLPAYREMVGPDQIFNYVLTVYACIPDALFTYIGSKLYERTDGTSYLIGRLKFSGIGFCNMHVSEVVHYSPRFLSKEGMFSAIYGTAPSSTSASSTNLPESSISLQEIQPATSSESQASASADPYLDTSIIESFHEDRAQDLEAQLKAAIAGEIPVEPPLGYSSRESPSLEVASLPKSTEDTKTVEDANSSRGGYVNAPIMMSKRNNRKKTTTSVPIPLEKILVSTPSSRYYVGARRKTPYKLDLDVTMVFHIDADWKIWKCETYNRGTMKFKNS